MKDVVARQSLSTGHHFFSADDTDVIHCLELLGGGIRVQCVHVADGSARHDGICHSFLELPHGQVHGPNGKERKCVHLDHDGHEGHVQQDLDKACKQLCVEHVHGLVVPGILTLEVHGVQHILDEDGEHHGHQNGVLEGRREGGIGDGVSTGFSSPWPGPGFSTAGAVIPTQASDTTGVLPAWERPAQPPKH